MTKLETIIDANWLKEKSACSVGVKWLKEITGIATTAGDILRDTLEKDQSDYFRWLATRLMDRMECVEWAVFCAEQAIRKFPNDARPRKAIDAARNYLAKEA